MKLLKIYYVVSFVIFLTVLLGAFIITQTFNKYSLGITAGYVVSVFPLAGWHWIIVISDGFRKNILKAVMLAVAKYIVIAAILYAIIKNDLFEPFSFVGGIGVTIFSLLIITVFQKKFESKK